MDTKHIKKIAKICRDNGIKEINVEGLKMVFDENMMAEKLSPRLKKPRNTKSLPNYIDPIKSKPQEQSIDEDDLILSDPLKWEEIQLGGGMNVN